MIDKIKLKCSKQYEEKLKKTFKYVETTSKEKTIVVNNDLECEFNPNLYVEQRIIRCLLQHDQIINEDDKIKFMTSLNRKTNRFLTDCDQSLFEDFSCISDVDVDEMYNENCKLVEKSYEQVIFESNFLETISEHDNIAKLTCTKSLLDENDKTFNDLVDIVKGFYNVENIDYFVIQVCDFKCQYYLIYSPSKTLENIYFYEGENIKYDNHNSHWKFESKFKFKDIINSLKELECYD